MAEAIYGLSIRTRPENSLVCVVRNRADVEIVGSYKIATGLNFPGPEFLHQHLVPACRDALGKRRLASSKRLIAADGLRISAEWLLLPDRKPDAANWCVAYVEIAFLLHSIGTTPIVDDTDRHLLQALMEGNTVKEIALRVGLSHRTVEHRFERLKARYGAQSLPHLVTLAIATSLPVEQRH